MACHYCIGTYLSDIPDTYVASSLRLVAKLVPAWNTRSGRNCRPGLRDDLSRIPVRRWERATIRVKEIPMSKTMRLDFVALAAARTAANEAGLYLVAGRDAARPPERAAGG